MNKSHIASPRVFVRNLLSNWVGMAAEMIVAFFLTPFIVYSLGTAAYGIWSLVISIIGYMGLIDMGIRGSVGRYINHYMARQDNKRINEVVSTSIAFLTIMCVFILGIAYLIAFNFELIFPKTPNNLLGDIRFVLPLMTINLWLVFVTSTFRSIIIALDRFEISNALNIIILILRTIGIVGVLRYQYGFIGLAFAVTGANLIAAMIFLLGTLLLYKPLNLSPLYVCSQRLSELWKFGIASFVTRSANHSIYQSDSIIVMIFFGPTMVAVYSIASMLIQYGQQLIEQIGGTLYPSIMKAGSLKDISGLQSLFVWHARLTFYLGTLVYMGLVVFGRHFLELWVGPDFLQAATVLAILSISRLLLLFASCGGSILFSLDNLKFNIFSSVSMALANILLSLLLIGLFGFGIEGVALGSLLSMLTIGSFIHPLYTTKFIGMSFNYYIGKVGIRGILLIIISFILFSMISNQLLTLGWSSFIACVGMATIIYLAVAAFVMFHRDELKLFLNKVLAKIVI